MPATSEGHRNPETGGGHSFSFSSFFPLFFHNFFPLFLLFPRTRGIFPPCLKRGWVLRIKIRLCPITNEGTIKGKREMEKKGCFVGATGSSTLSTSIDKGDTLYRFFSRPLIPPGHPCFSATPLLFRLAVFLISLSQTDPTGLPLFSFAL